jgi:cell division protein FtsQ
VRRVTLAARRAQRFLRRPPPPRWRRPVLAGALLGLVLLMLGAGATALSRSGLLEQMRFAIVDHALGWTTSLGLRVQEILVDGRTRTTREALLARLDVHVGQPLLAVSPGQLRARLEQLDWVEQAEVARLLPGVVHVRLIERRPLALWQRDGRLHLIDHDGVVIHTEGDQPGELARWRDLPVVVGAGAGQAAAKLFALLSTEPELWSRVVALTFIGERRWTLRLDNQVDVLLPEENVLAAWRTLAEQAHRHALLERAVTVVDLRFLPDRIRLRLDRAAMTAEHAA